MPQCELKMHSRRTNLSLTIGTWLANVVPKMPTFFEVTPLNYRRENLTDNPSLETGADKDRPVALHESCFAVENSASPLTNWASRARIPSKSGPLVSVTWRRNSNPA
jgi:hypothetical protein